MSKQKDYKFKFSVVIPVYNVENYLKETVDSVIAQTIGFKENIQIIFVNDGSPDNSEKICKKYQEKYPDNIVYVLQENAGVSAARNNGINYIEGKYVNFLDSDDCWKKDAFALVYSFFEENEELIDVVGARKKFFDARTGFHHLDYKFSSTRVIDLLANYEMIQMDVTGAFVKSSAIGKTRFSTNLKYGEDAHFINSIVLDKCRIGVVREAVHLYRRRSDESSALQNELKSESYYFDSPKYFHNDLIQQSIKRYGRVLEFIQYTVMYDIRWRLGKDLTGMLSNEMLAEYKSVINKTLSYIDDRIILLQKNMGVGAKVYALNIKYKKDVTKDLEYDHGKLLFNNINVMNLLDVRSLLIFTFMEIVDDVLYIEGKDNLFLNREDYSFYATVNGKDYTPELYYTDKYDTNILGLKAFSGKGFKMAIPVKKGREDNIEFFLKYKDTYITRIYVSMGKFAHLPSAGGEAGYYCMGDYILRIKGKTLKIIPYKNRRHLKYELQYWKHLRKVKRRYLIKSRILYFLMRPFNKNVWLISDRPNKAGDNGEHFFKYVQSIKHKGIKPYFVIQKDSEDYEKMSKIGKIIDFNSVMFRLMTLQSTNVISSQASEYILNPYEGDYKYMSDLYNYNFVFLQHGITKDDISGWLNKTNKNIKLFVTAGKPEYRSIIDGDYFYDENVVRLTGFPRFDNLARMGKNVKKKILIIPTWRKSLNKCVDPDTDTSVYYDKFKESEFFEFYNSLINNKQLTDCMKKNGYEGLFCLHPLFAQQYVDFTENDVFKVNHGYVDYQTQFAESALLVTDYSSVFFDFGYLKKPVVYSQFDKEAFFKGHSYSEGYFSYDDNGFGPVCKDLNSTVKAICSYIENDCKNSDKYIKRIEEFYPFFDENSCERVYKDVLRLSDK